MPVAQALQIINGILCPGPVTDNAVTGATGTAFKVKKPDGSKVTWTATVSGTTHLTYTTASGDFNLGGDYILQSYLTIDGWTGYGTAIKFTIYSLYDDEE